jgi:hypothetical protein
MKTYAGVDVLIQVFMTSELVGDEWSQDRLDGRLSGLHNRSGLPDVEKNLASTWTPTPTPSTVHP